MTFAISLQLPGRGTGLAGQAGRRRAGSWKHARRKRRLSRRRPGAHVRALSRLLQPCRHRVIRPACSHPRMPRDPIRMLARVTRSRQRPMNPTLLRERGAVVDDGAHQGSDGTRPAGRTRPGPGVPGPQLTRSATGDAAATSEPDQAEVLDDGVGRHRRARSRKDRGPCAGADRQAPPVDVAAAGQQDAPAGQLPQHAPDSRSWEVKAFIVSPLRSVFRRARDLARRNYLRHLPWAAPSGDPGSTWPPPAADPRLPAPNLHSQSETSNVFLETV